MLAVATIIIITTIAIIMIIITYANNFIHCSPRASEHLVVLVRQARRYDHCVEGSLGWLSAHA